MNLLVTINKQYVTHINLIFAIQRPYKVTTNFLNLVRNYFDIRLIQRSIILIGNSDPFTSKSVTRN